MKSDTSCKLIRNYVREFNSQSYRDYKVDQVLFVVVLYERGLYYETTDPTRSFNNITFQLFSNNNS